MKIFNKSVKYPVCYNYTGGKSVKIQRELKNKNITVAVHIMGQVIVVLQLLHVAIFRRRDLIQTK